MWLMVKKFNYLLTPKWVFNTLNKVLPWCLLLAMVLLAYGVWQSLVVSPKDYQQGEGVRIMYVHVPCAMLSMALYAWMALCSGIYLIFRIKLYDIFAKQAAPIGCLFTVLALLTGSLWGKPMWGTWWIWDARLTSELILLFLYMAYMLLDQSLPKGQASAKACALLAIIGFVDIPIIHYSVEWWHTLHQGSSLSLLKKPSMDSSMLIPLLIMLAGFSFLTASLWMLRVKTALMSKFKSHWKEGPHGF